MWDERFEELLRRHLPFLPEDGALTEDLSLRDFGLDSMAAVELLGALERTYQVRFVDDALDLANFVNPRQLWLTISGIVAVPGR